jgi:hypothetical protein
LKPHAYPKITGTAKFLPKAMTPFMLSLLLCSLSSTLIRSFSIGVASNIQCRFSPLVGGPEWLPVHVKIVVDKEHIFDYVPQNATSPATLTKLLSLQAVPANARIFSDNDETSVSTSVERARVCCKAYDKDLHIVTNNCWTFALDLISYIQG